MSDDARDDTLLTVRERRCPVCGEWYQPVGRARYCSQACRQHAYRLRHAQVQTREAKLETWMRGLERRSAVLQQTAYECPSCEQRYLLIRCCPDCNLICRKLGLGGTARCDELILVSELIGTDVA